MGSAGHVSREQHLLGMLIGLAELAVFIGLTVLMVVWFNHVRRYERLLADSAEEK
jgi:hypothetical protein